MGSRVVYFPQGHSEQADVETDEVYAQMTLQPLTPNAVRAICMEEVESLVKKCGKLKMLDAIRLPPTKLYRHVEVCFDVLVRNCQVCIGYCSVVEICRNWRKNFQTLFI
ncbi:hypothetical protein ACS0TY_015897 [Phlomoides rotata]